MANKRAFVYFPDRVFSKLHNFRRCLCGLMSRYETKQMKKLLALLFVALLATSSVSTVQAEDKVRYEVGSGVYNAYHASSSGTMFHDGMVFHSSLSATLPSGVSFKVWNSYSPNGVYDKGDETDLSASVPFRLGGFSFRAKYAYWILYGTDLHSLSLDVDAPAIVGITLFASVNWLISADADELEGGYLGKLGLKTALDIEGQKVPARAYLGFVDAFGNDAKLPAIVRFDVSTEIRLTEGLYLCPEVHYQIPIEAECDEDLFGGAELCYRF